MLIEANYEGRRGDFVFDTGADEILLHTDDEIQSQTVFETLDSEIYTEEAQIDYLRLGNYWEEDVTVYKADLQSISRFTGTQVAGIIGLSVFDVEILHIDNVNNIIKLYTLDYINTLNDRKYIRNKMSLEGKLPVINVEIEDNTYRFVMDSGASTSFICDSVIGNHTDQFDDLDLTSQVITLSDKTTHQQYSSCSAITLGKLRLKNFTFGRRDFTQFDDISGIISIDSLPSDVIIFDFVTRHIYMSI